MKRRLLTVCGIVVPFVLLAALVLFSAPAQAKPEGLTINVNNHSTDQGDATPGNGLCETVNGNNVCTLRAAIQEANALPGAEIINLEANQTYTLTRAGNDQTAIDGDLDLLSDMTINGNNAIVDANGNVTADRAFKVNNLASVIISDLTIQNGHPNANGGGILNYGGSLSLNHVTVQNNTSNFSGGGIASTGKMTIANSTITNNTSGSASNGGGIYTNADTLISNSAIYGNSAGNYGGGIFTSGFTVYVANSTIRGNHANQSGGGIAVDGGTTRWHNVTIADNVADYDDNNVGTGGGVYQSNSAQIYFANSILANNVLENGVVDTISDCSGSFNSSSYNIIRSTSSCTISANTGDQFGTNPKLGTFGNHGGWTQTYDLASDSPAIDNGNPNGCYGPNVNIATVLTTDQRGYARPVNGGTSNTCDIGAFEYNSAPAVNTVTPTHTATPTKTSTATAVPTQTATATATATTSACVGTPTKPIIVAPTNGSSGSKAKVILDWSDDSCAVTYSVTVKQDSKQGVKAFGKGSLSVSTVTTTALAKGHTYFWKVRSCFNAVCTKSSWSSFTITP